MGHWTGWVKDGNGDVFWDNNTNSQEEFNLNYANKSGYSYANDHYNPNSYTLPSGEEQLVINSWSDGFNSISGSILGGLGNVGINISFIPTNSSAEVGWIQTYCSNTDVNSGNLWSVLPTTNVCTEYTDGGGAGGSTDPSAARYYETNPVNKKPVSTLADGPLRAKLPEAQYNVSFNAQSTATVNGRRAVSIGWGVTVNSETNQTVCTPSILKSTTLFHNKAVQKVIGN